MSLIQQQTQIRVNPKKILFYSSPKAGKTTAMSGLKDALIIDLEDGSSFITGNIVNVLAIAGERINCAAKHVLNHPDGPKTCIDVLRELIEELKNSNVKYKYIVIDSVTALVEIATWLGSQMYKQTTQGKNYTGNNVVNDLANGAGYAFLREAYEKILNSIEPHATECSIQVGHVKDASIMKMGGDVTARDLQLPGFKLARIYLIAGKSLESLGYNIKVETLNI